MLKQMSKEIYKVMSIKEIKEELENKYNTNLDEYKPSKMELSKVLAKKELMKKTINGKEILVPVDRKGLTWLLMQAQSIKTTSTKWIKLDDQISYLDEADKDLIVEILCMAAQDGDVEGALCAFDNRTDTIHREEVVGFLLKNI